MATLNLNFTGGTNRTTTCTHSDHNPKVGAVLAEGLTHRCPGCGYNFHVSALTVAQASAIRMVNPASTSGEADDGEGSLTP